MNSEHYVIVKLAECMHAAAVTGSERIAYGCMLRNRVQEHRSSWYTELRTLAVPTRIERPDDPDFLGTLWDAESIYYNRQADTINGCVEMAPVDDSKPYYASQVGRLQFWKWI